MKKTYLHIALALAVTAASFVGMTEGAFAKTEASGSDPETQDVCIAGVAKIGVPFVGIETARAFEAHDFDGTTLQGAGKGGQWISKDNLKAVVKVHATITGA